MFSPKSKRYLRMPDGVGPPPATSYGASGSTSAEKRPKGDVARWSIDFEASERDSRGTPESGEAMSATSSDAESEVVDDPLSRNPSPTETDGEAGAREMAVGTGAKLETGEESQEGTRENSYHVTGPSPELPRIGPE